MSVATLIPLLVFDANFITSLPPIRLHNEQTGAIAWQGDTYHPWPFEVTGFAGSTTGTLPEQTLILGNLLQLPAPWSRRWADLSIAFQELAGAEVTVRYITESALTIGADAVIARTGRVLGVAEDRADQITFRLGAPYDRPEFRTGRSISRRIFPGVDGRRQA